MDRLASIGRSFFAIAMIVFGSQHVVFGDFVTRVVPWWPAWVPGRSFWAWTVGALLIAAGMAILAEKRTSRVATLLGLFILLSFACLGLAVAAADSVLGGGWTVAGKALALSGGAFLVARSAASSIVENGADLWRLRALWLLGPWFFGTFLTLCGIQHFVHVVFVTSLVPSWMPGALFWTYFTGVALIAGGIGVVVPRTARLAGMLSGLMIFAWVLMVHIPRAFAAGTRSTNETTAVFEALAMSGIAFLIAATAVQPASVTSRPVARAPERVPTRA